MRLTSSESSVSRFASVQGWGGGGWGGMTSNPVRLTRASVQEWGGVCTVFIILSLQDLTDAPNTKVSRFVGSPNKNFNVKPGKQEKPRKPRYLRRFAKKHL